jgi:hypothetical protein
MLGVPMDVDYTWDYLCTLFSGVKGFEESTVVIESDREVKFRSLSLLFYYNNVWRLEKGRLPDLRFQNVNIETKIHAKVDEFMNGNDFLGLLLGPTGCGKSFELLNRAKTEFAIFVDAQLYPASQEPNDVSVSSLKQTFESVVNTWKARNEDLPRLRTIAYAFILSRMLFLKFLKGAYNDLSPTHFLIHQLFNSLAIDKCFLELKSLPLDTLKKIRYHYIDFQCLFCIDEAHVLVSHLGDNIITSMDGYHVQQNGDVNEDAKRGTLSVLLFAIKDGQFATKAIFAGTSSKLRNIDNFGTFETKPVAPVVLNHFTAWDHKMALEYVMAFVDIGHNFLETVLTDNYRPRILENLVYDLFCIGMNDNESPTTKNERVEKLLELKDISDILKESYTAVIHRFIRVSIKPMASTIRNHSQTEIMLKLLLSSMMTTNHTPINCQLNQNQINFFSDTVGSIYLIFENGGYSFFEGYVIDSFLIQFEEELKHYNLTCSLNLLKSVIEMEGKKTTAKGTPFEAVVLAELIKRNDESLSQLLKKFSIIVNGFDDLCLPTKQEKYGDEDIISKRPQNVFLRPSNQFRPDILAFLSESVCFSSGIKLYTSNISTAVHEDNLESTDPSLFFSKQKRPTNQGNYLKWQESIRIKPFTLSVRVLFELPNPVQNVSTESVHVKTEQQEHVIIMISKQNMDLIFCKEVVTLVNFITSS